MTQLGLDVSLSDREREVLFLAADGLTDKEIAVRLEIGIKTVRTYWDRMRAKLGASSRTQCLAMALRSAYQAVAQSEERLRTFVHNMPVMFCAYDERLNIISSNLECERVSGYPIEKILEGGTFMEKAYPDPRVRNQRYQTFSSREGDYKDLETEISCADGSKKIIAWSSTAKDAPIEGWHSWGIGVDVTERRRAEHELAASETRYRQLLETSSQGIWIIDTDYVTSFANQRLAELLGFDREEILGKSIVEFRSENDPEMLRDLLGNGSSSGSRVSFNFKFKRKDGGVLYAAVDVSPIFDAEGNLTGHSAVLQDISHRKRLEHRLKITSEAYSKLLQTTPAPVIRFMPDHTVSWANFQLSGEPLASLSHQQLMDELQPTKKWELGLKHSFESGEQTSFEAHLVGKNGPISTKATLVPEPSDSFTVASVIAVMDNFELL